MLIETLYFAIFLGVRISPHAGDYIIGYTFKTRTSIKKIRQTDRVHMPRLACATQHEMFSRRRHAIVGELLIECASNKSSGESAQMRSLVRALAPHIQNISIHLEDRGRLQRMSSRYKYI